MFLGVNMWYIKCVVKGLEHTLLMGIMLPPRGQELYLGR